MIPSRMMSIGMICECLNDVIYWSEVPNCRSVGGFVEDGTCRR